MSKKVFIGVGHGGSRLRSGRAFGGKRGEFG